MNRLAGLFSLDDLGLLANKSQEPLVAWEPGEPWPSRDGPLDGPQGPAPGIPWVPQNPRTV